jgi:Protein of unknown function (DUF2735)
MEKGMATNTDQESAQIIQFPAGGRAGVKDQRNEARPDHDQAMPRVAKVSSGGAWYHEEAIRETERAHNN